MLQQLEQQPWAQGHGGGALEELERPSAQWQGAEGGGGSSYQASPMSAAAPLPRLPSMTQPADSRPSDLM
jgi:hypothetical protein